MGGGDVACDVTRLYLKDFQARISGLNLVILLLTAKRTQISLCERFDQYAFDLDHGQCESPNKIDQHIHFKRRGNR